MTQVRPCRSTAGGQAALHQHEIDLVLMRAPIRGREKPIRASATTRRSRPARRTRSWKPRLRIPSRTRPRPPMPAAICSRGARALMESWASIWPGDRDGRATHLPRRQLGKAGRPPGGSRRRPAVGSTGSQRLSRFAPVQAEVEEVFGSCGRGCSAARGRGVRPGGVDRLLSQRRRPQRSATSSPGEMASFVAANAGGSSRHAASGDAQKRLKPSGISGSVAALRGGPFPGRRVARTEEVTEGRCTICGLRAVRRYASVMLC